MKKNIMQQIWSESHCNNCHKPWLGSFWSKPNCNECVAEMEQGFAEFQDAGDNHDCSMSTHGYCPACEKIYAEAARALPESEKQRIANS